MTRLERFSLAAALASVLGAAPVLAQEPSPTPYPAPAEIETRPVRKGTGNLFTARQGNVKRLPPLPAKPTLVDYFNLRFTNTANHCFQSANRALVPFLSPRVLAGVFAW